jgi:hypothetical protein
MFNKARDIVRAQGILGLVRRSMAYAYRRGVRPCIPGKPVYYDGIPICHDRNWVDELIPRAWVPHGCADEPAYEPTLVAAMRDIVRSGDTVVIVGAGLGVTAVVSALCAGPSGIVQCFEASKQYVAFAQKTAARNKLSNISVHHAVVAKPIYVYGGGRDLGPIRSPSQLPSCDVLELDCEGAEVDILRQLTIQPRAIVIETHGLFGAPTELVRRLLEERGFVVSDRGWAEPDWGDYCSKNDMRVVVGTKQLHHHAIAKAEEK